MILPKAQLEEVREAISSAQRPVYFFHDDPDGVSSFLLIYRRIREGKGIIVKTTPKVSTMFLRKVKDYSPDTIFITDLALLEQDFIDSVNVPIYWIDHHTPLHLKGVNYYNPRIKAPGVNVPASRVCYEIVQEDMWIATMGTIADWVLDEPLYKRFCKEYPDLADPTMNRIEDILVGTELGKLIRIVSFILKGTANDAMKYVKVLTRVESPYDILQQRTTQGKFIYKRYASIQKLYDELYADATKNVSRSNVLLYKYEEDKLSLTKDLANDLLIRYPNKVIIIGRHKDDEIKMSLRAANYILPPILERALAGLDGYGGGHEHACGACVKADHFDEFLKQLKKGLKQAKPQK